MQGEKDSLYEQSQGFRSFLSGFADGGTEGDWRATVGKTGAVPVPRPDPEVVARGKRRRFTAEYKQRIVTEANRLKGSGELGAMLRREGLYSSVLTTWRDEAKAGALRPEWDAFGTWRVFGGGRRGTPSRGQAA